MKEFRVRALVLGSGADGTAPTLVASLEWRSAASPDDPWHPLERVLFNACEGVQRVCMETRTKLRSLRAIMFTVLSAELVVGMPGLLFAMSSLGAARLAVSGPTGTSRYTAAARSFVRRRWPEVAASDAAVEGGVVYESDLIIVRSIVVRLADGVAAGAASPRETVCYVTRFTLPQPRAAGAAAAAAAPPFAALLVVDCPSTSFIAALAASDQLCSEYRALRDAGVPICVAHLASRAVCAGSDAQYEQWALRQFEGTLQVRLAARAEEQPAAFRAATTAQIVMHALAPQFFVSPLLDPPAAGASATATATALTAAAAREEIGRPLTLIAVGGGAVVGQRGTGAAAWSAVQRARDHDGVEATAAPAAPLAAPLAAPAAAPPAAVATAEERRRAEDGSLYTKREFSAYFGRLDEWNVAAIAGSSSGGEEGALPAKADATAAARRRRGDDDIVRPLVGALSAATPQLADALVAKVLAASREGAGVERCVELDGATAADAARREQRWRALHTLGGTRVVSHAAPWAECSAVPSAASTAARRHPLKVIFLGTGAATPSRHRGSSAIWLGACGCASGGRGVVGSDVAMLLDCGEGAYGQLDRCFGRGVGGIDTALLALQCIWISHVHLDHHMGLLRILAERGEALRRECEREAAAGRMARIRPPLLIVAPHGIKRFLDAWFQLPLHAAHARTPHPGEREYRFVSHAECRGRPVPLLPPPFCGIQSVAVEHCPEAFGAVVDVAPCGSGSAAAPCRIVYSGDTRPCARLAHAGRGATLLLHEATFADNEADHAVRKRHSTVSEAVGVGKAMQAHALVLTHFSQRRFVPRLSEEAEADPRIAMAFDLMVVPIALAPLHPSMCGGYGGFQRPSWRWCARLPSARGSGVDGAAGVTIDTALLRSLFEVEEKSGIAAV